MKPLISCAIPHPFFPPPHLNSFHPFHSAVAPLLGTSAPSIRDPLTGGISITASHTPTATLVGEQMLSICLRGFRHFSGTPKTELCTKSACKYPQGAERQRIIARKEAATLFTHTVNLIYVSVVCNIDLIAKGQASPSST